MSSTPLSRDKLLHDLFCVFESFGKVGIVSDQFVIKVECLTVTLFVDICDVALVRRKKNFGLIIKHNLYGLITKSEKDSMFSTNPFLDKYETGIRSAVVLGCYETVSFQFLLLFHQVIVEVFQ